MKISKYKAYFGWDGDEGIGEMLIEQIINKQKTATCGFKVLYTEEDLKEEYECIGNIVTVMDQFDRPRCNIKVLEVFETTFGNPDLRLVYGEGDDSVKKFQDDHRVAYLNTVKNIPLSEDTILITTLFELVEVNKC